MRQADSTGRHVVVTGASSGIGRATALRLVGAGDHVFAGVREPADGEALRRAAVRGRLTPLLLDVTDAGQIAAAAATVDGHAGNAGLDGLVDNAGIGTAWPLELVPLDLFRRQLEVNLVGQLAVTQAFLPLLRRARGRLIVIGSIGDRITMPFAGPLTASKHAVASVADALRQELAPWGIRVVLIEPASIRTDAVGKLERDARRAVDSFTAGGRLLYQDTYQRMITSAVARERRGSPPEVVAEVVARALTSARPRARYLAGKHARLLAAMNSLLPTPVLDAVRRGIFQLPAPGSMAGPASPPAPRDRRRSA